MGSTMRYVLAVFMGIMTLITSAFSVLTPASAYDYSFVDEIDWWTAEEAGYYMDESNSMMSDESMEIITAKYLTTETTPEEDEFAYLLDFTAGATAESSGYTYTVTEGYAEETAAGYYVAQSAVIASNNTKVLQAMLDDVYAAGGGTVYVSGGAYKIASIKVYSNTTLRIAEGSSLVNVTYDEKVYLTNLGTDENGVAVSNFGSILIQITNSENVTIEGPGSIDGNGRTYCDDAMGVGGSLLPEDMTTFSMQSYVVSFRQYICYAKSSSGRGYTIRTSNVDGLTIRNLLSEESGNWNMRIHTSTDVLVENVIINNNVHVENGDGINFVGCDGVTMTHCFVAAADDGICLKTSSLASYSGDDGCTDHYISDCEVTSLASCFKIGTPTSGAVDNINVWDCNFFRADIMGGYAGISLESADGTVMTNVNISDINMDGILSPVLIWLGNRLDHGVDEIGSISGVTIENIYAKDVDVASAIVGCTDLDDITTINYVEDVTLRNFYVTYREGVTEDLSLPGIMEVLLAQTSSTVYPEISRVLYLGMGNYEESLMYDMPVYGLYCRYVDGLTVENFNVKPREDTVLPLDNVQSVFDRFSVNNVSWT